MKTNGSVWRLGTLLGGGAVMLGLSGAAGRGSKRADGGSSREMRKLQFLVGTWTGKFAPPSEGQVPCQTTWVGQGEYLLMQEDYRMPPNPYLACLSLIG